MPILQYIGALTRGTIRFYLTCQTLINSHLASEFITLSSRRLPVYGPQSLVISL
ncbi:hypothetical protein MX009_01570 [Streptococcus uberis]|uniref:hypothetical protein n=1 Tax=Streptococcus uberis TaxID=1349 RepID=UPI001360AA46|nr:hypothetical protein [Streptococcus uberis]MCK1213901.1 hypothetical protein [Streptococcus uberis]MCK1229112.1 hypothetical protein [Streptococcus uberis]MTB93130.1 hypothetical protein [Streptococcus uberis]